MEWFIQVQSSLPKPKLALKQITQFLHKPGWQLYVTVDYEPKPKFFIKIQATTKKKVMKNNLTHKICKKCICVLLHEILIKLSWTL